MVIREGKRVWSGSVVPWYAFHAGMGVLGLWMIMQAVA